MITSNEEAWDVLYKLILESTTTERFFEVMKLCESAGLSGAIVIAKTLTF